MNKYPAYEIDDVPECYGKVLRRIQELLGSKILIYEYDKEWLNFGVANQWDRLAIMTLEAKKAMIFPNHEMFLYQVLCPFSPADNSGLWLHYMPNSTTQREYPWGCWLY